MTKIEELFNASQFVTMKCINNLCEVHGDLQDVNVNSARVNMTFLRDNLETLDKVIAAIEKEEYGELPSLIDDEEEEEPEFDSEEIFSSSSSTVRVDDDGKEIDDEDDLDDVLDEDDISSSSTSSVLDQKEEI